MGPERLLLDDKTIKSETQIFVVFGPKIFENKVNTLRVIVIPPPGTKVKEQDATFDLEFLPPPDDEPK